MADIMDYIDWRGDIGFDEVHVNEVDGLIFSQLIYVQMKPYMPDAKKSYLTIKQLSSLYCADHSDDEIEQMPNLFRHSARLLQKLAHSRRYADCILRYYIYDISEKEESQFSAVTIELPDGTYFISYSGTDHSVVGWKENFNLSYLDETPGQNKAKKYLKQVAAYIYNDDRGINEKAINDKALDDENINNKSINTRKLWIGGHSKGGNLAVYAGAFTDENSRNHIDYIYNFDGPGFSLDKIKDSGFYEIDDRIYTFVPQSSIFGMMFEHEESYTIVKSNQQGFLQHYIYSWEIEQNSLVRLKSTTNFSVFFDHTLKEFVESLTIAQRREFTKEVFALLSLTETATFNEMLKNPLKNTGTILKSFAGLDSKTRNMLLKTIFAFVKSAKNNFSDITGGQNKITVS